MNNLNGSDNQKQKLPQTVYASILLALICCVMCIVIIGLVVALNWNNPIWDQKIKLLAIGVIAVTVAIAAFFGWLIRKRIR